LFCSRRSLIYFYGPVIYIYNNYIQLSQNIANLTFCDRKRPRSDWRHFASQFIGFIHTASCPNVLLLLLHFTYYTRKKLNKLVSRASALSVRYAYTRLFLSSAIFRIYNIIILLLYIYLYSMHIHAWNALNYAILKNPSMKYYVLYWRYNTKLVLSPIVIINDFVVEFYCAEFYQIQTETYIFGSVRVS